MDDYTYTFDAIDDCLGAARVIAPHAGLDLTFQVATRDRHLAYWSSTEALPQIADLVDLAHAVYIADRFLSGISGRSARIQVTLPVRRPELLGAPAVLEMLRDVLYWYTEDLWSFSFTQRRGVRLAERQASFVPTLHQGEPTEVALWSGGLDSLAGLWHRQLQRPKTRYVLFGTGSNRLILSRQRSLARRFEKVSRANVSLIQVPQRLQTPRRTTRNRYQRTRGFVFLLLGAVCARIEGQSTLHLYENGVGALNLPFRPAEVGVDHSRAVHPLSLLKMGQLVSRLLGTNFTFANPFLFHTKAEICTSLRGTAAEPLVPHSISCDSRLRRPGQPPQCGHCSSCLLRRQALAAIGLTDMTAYAHQDPADPADRFALKLMLQQRDTIRSCLVAASPWVALRRQHPVLEKTVTRLAKATCSSPEQLAAQVLDLYRRYAGEWDQVQYLLGTEASHTQR